MNAGDVTSVLGPMRQFARATLAFASHADLAQRSSTRPQQRYSDRSMMHRGQVDKRLAKRAVSFLTRYFSIYLIREGLDDFSPAHRSKGYEACMANAPNPRRTGSSWGCTGTWKKQ